MVARTILQRSLGLAAALSALFTLGFPTASVAQDQINVRFSWKMKGEYAPLYMAQEKGFYQKEGLAVRMGEGAGAPAALGALLQGQEDIVILPGIFALTAITKGMPVKIVALYHPEAPVALISHPQNPVRTPKDLEGKSIAVSVGETGTSYLDYFCKRNNIDCGKIRRVQTNAQTRVPQFLQKQVDVVSVYQTNDLPILMSKEKVEFVILDMVKFGYGLPGLAAVTSDAHIQKKPDAIKRFLKALGAGVVEAKADVGEATRAIMKSWSGSPDATVVGAQVKATVDAIPAAGGKPVGWIDEKGLSNTLEILKGVGEIDQIKALPTYYTNALL